MARIVPLANLDDPDLEPYRDVRDRDLRGRGNAFMAEGAVVLANAAGRMRHRLRSLLVAEPKLAGLEPALARLPADLPVYVAGAQQMSEIAGFHIHRGVLALGERAVEPPLEDLLAALPPRALVVALFGISNHDNLGGIFRNAVAFGADAVLLDPACCDPLYRKAIRVSVGASLICPFVRVESEAALLAEIATSALTPVALTPGGHADLSMLPAASGGLALLVGSEGHGLPPAALERSLAIRIEMAPGFDSLNAATATGIALHAAARALGKV